jgi:hypothetical protein
MFIKFLKLEWKSFFRASSFQTNMALKIFMALGAIYFIGMFLLLGFGAYYIIEDYMKQEPLVVVSRYMIYYIIMDLIIRLFFQKIPVINIKPLLTLPIKRSSIVNFALAKTGWSFFSVIHAFFLIPFTITLIINGHDTFGSLLWMLGIFALLYVNNFLNILLNSKDNLFMIFIGLLAAIAALQYYNLFNVTDYTVDLFYGLFSKPYLVAVPLLLLAGIWYATYGYLYRHLYLDTGLKGKHDIAKTEEYTWLNQFGTLGTFLKNDIKLIRRNKRSKTTLLMSVMFLFYGLLFMTGALEVYDHPMWKIFAGIFVSGGFLFTFGQFVPSWDSAYYPLMMSQNIKYRDYIKSKWWLVVIGTIASTIAASFYLYFGFDTYLIVLVAAVFNIGVNSHLVLLGGAFIKTPIDLASGKQAFGDKKAFNVKTMLLSLPKMFLPMALYAAGYYLISPEAGYAFVAGAGVLGLAFRNKVFSMIENIYKTEKYSTLAAYRQKN